MMVEWAGLAGEGGGGSGEVGTAGGESAVEDGFESGGTSRRSGRLKEPAGSWTAGELQGKSLIAVMVWFLHNGWKECLKSWRGKLSNRHHSMTWCRDHQRR